MKSVRVILVSVTCLLTVNGVLARTPYKLKNEDRYKTLENDISADVPSLPIQGGYREPETVLEELSADELKRIYGMTGIFGRESGYDGETPYYYYSFNPSVIYDPKSPFFIGNEYDLTNPYVAEYASDPYSGSTDDLPDGAIISESEGQAFVGNDELDGTSEEPTFAEDIVTPADDQSYGYPEAEESQPETYWPSPANKPSTDGYFNNFMMGIPAQLQSFPMFNPEYYQSDYEAYERFAAETERQQEELDAQGLDANTVEKPENFPRGGRSKRGFARKLNLRDKNGDGSAHVSGKGINGKSGNVVLNADCRGGYGNNGGGRPDPRNNAGTGNAANGVADAAGTVQNAAGQVSGAAGDAVDAATNAAENLRLSNGRRTNNRRNGNNNRNNNRRGIE